MAETAEILTRLFETPRSPLSSLVCCPAMTTRSPPLLAGGLVKGGCQGIVRGAVDHATQAYRRASNATESILQYHVRFQPRILPAIVLPEFGPACHRFKPLVLIVLQRLDECVCSDIFLLDIILQI